MLTPGQDLSAALFRPYGTRMINLFSDLVDDSVNNFAVLLL